MSGAGRGTPRVNPIAGSFPDWNILEDNNFYMPTQGMWGFCRDYDPAEVQVLTAAFEPYIYQQPNVDIFKIPYGATRGAIYGTYVPGQVAGLLEVSVRWVDQAELDRYVFEVPDLDNATYGLAPDVNLATIQVYDQTRALPDSASTDPVRFVLPFWVPSIRPMGLNTPFLSLPFRVYVRDAAGTPGTFQIDSLTAESFGQPHPIVRT